MIGHASYRFVKGPRRESECKTCGGRSLYQAPDVDYPCFCVTHPKECDPELCPYCAERLVYERPCAACGELVAENAECPCITECEHDDADDFTCLYCGKDLTEALMALAYDQAKAEDE